jgi:hypothetical protein
LVEEKHVRGTPFILIKVKSVRRPTGAAVSAGLEQRLKDRILPANEAYGRTQHLRAREATAEKSALTDLP